MAFLKLMGRPADATRTGVVRPLVNKNDWPRFTEEEPEIYERAEVTQFLDACESNERLWFEFFLMTGMREQEVMHMYWSDVSFAKFTVKVTHKPDYGWTPKAYKEREIPIPESLIASLKAATPQQSAPRPPQAANADAESGERATGNGVERLPRRLRRRRWS
jgi:integrase